MFQVLLRYLVLKVILDKEPLGFDENKACTGSDCRAKIQAEVDEIETFFVDRMTQYTGWSAEQVISNFDRGGTISAAIVTGKQIGRAHV